MLPYSEAIGSSFQFCQKEPVEHVYTVCPAVVRKPRVSKEVLEEREAEALAQAANASITSTPAVVTPPAVVTSPVLQENEQQPSGPYNNTASSVFSVLDDLPTPGNRRTSSPVEGASAMEPRPRVPARSKTMKGATALPAGALSCPTTKEVSINAANTIENLPPPLPSRPKSNMTSSSSSTLPSTYSLNPLIHPITGSSNDSDFVSAEVISQLRMKRANAKQDTESVSHDDASDSAPNSLSLASNAVNSMSKHERSSSTPSIEEESSIKIDLVSQAEAPEESAAPSFLRQSYSSSSSPELEQMLELPNNNSTSGALENEYSLLPSHSGACALPSSAFEKADYEVSEKTFSSALELSNSARRPTPRPRHALVKQVCLEDDPPQPEESNSLISAKPKSNYDNVMPTLFLDEPEQNGCQLEDERKNQKTDKLKDENENCYGLIFNPASYIPPIPPIPATPPTPPTPPISPIPPLPPRHDSLPEAPQSSGSSLNTYSPVVKSHGDNAPPLPLPRKNQLGSKYGNLCQVPASNVWQDLEIPPMPSRRRSPEPRKAMSYDDSHKCMGYEDKPPALPTRPSSSFYIKRPLLKSQLDSDSSSPQAPAASALPLQANESGKEFVLFIHLLFQVTFHSPP